MFALVDCNNFYASCERAFNPSLERKPIVVLSNNDGCIIARSNEAKVLGIPMGAPFFKWEVWCRKNKVAVFSSNYELYGDMSQRIMTLLKDNCPEVEVYSIDEAFLSLGSFSFDKLMSYLIELRHKIKMYTGIPVSIGLASTKTLAKIANHWAKNTTVNGVFDMRSPVQQELVLSEIKIEKIWGVGRQLTSKLQDLAIYTAKDLRDADVSLIRKRFSVTAERVVRELRGFSCIPLSAIQPRQQIISSRSFSKLVKVFSELEEAVSHYTATACMKLRKQDSVASAIGVFVQTSAYNKKEHLYQSFISAPFIKPTADTRYIISIAKQCVRELYKPNFGYRKAGIILLDLLPSSVVQQDILLKPSSAQGEVLMKTLDNINKKLGNNTVFYGAEGVNQSWKIKCDKRSPRYTTRWDELLRIS